MDRHDEQREPKRIELALPDVKPEEITVFKRTFIFPNPEVVFEEGRKAALRHQHADRERGLNEFAAYMALSNVLFFARDGLRAAKRIEEELAALDIANKDNHPAIVRLRFDLQDRCEEAVRWLIRSKDPFSVVLAMRERKE